MALTKNQHWMSMHFEPFLRANVKIPFEWGTQDCCLFAASAVEAMTGTDIAAEFRGKYTTKLGAWRAISKITGGTTVGDAVAYCAEKHGLVEYTNPLMAKRGDLVLIENAGDLICGVVHLTGIHVISVAESGTVRLPIADSNGKPNVVRAWSI